jgi:hypothetical protein
MAAPICERLTDLQAGGRWFEPNRAHQHKQRLSTLTDSNGDSNAFAGWAATSMPARARVPSAAARSPAAPVQSKPPARYDSSA